NRVERMSVTALPGHLKCADRFYLKHVLKLSELHDAQLEVDGALFGVLAHNVLHEFALVQKDVGNDVRAISEFLSETLEKLFDRKFGTNPLPSVLIQKDQLAGRLGVFAKWQSAWAAA